MTPILSLSPDDLRRYQSDGKAFTELIDGVLRASAARCGIPDAALATNLRVTIPDGGVDTQVNHSSDGDPSGRFACPSIWQYKSGRVEHPSTPAALEDAGHVAAKLRDGYGYRLVIADSLTARDKEKWEASLTQAAREANSSAPAALVITIDDLAAWINEFPALVLPRIDTLVGSLRSFALWRDNITEATRHYVSVPVWQHAERALADHCNLASTPRRAVFTLLGTAGVGKTRLVLEVLKTIPNAASTVVYTRDNKDALRLVHFAAQRPRATLILVADECPVETRQELDEVLGDEARRRRIRVIAIEATHAQRATAILKPMPWRALNEILARNYAHVPIDRRLRYARLAKGYVRLAVYLCEEDPIERGLALSEVGIPDLLGTRLSDPQQRALFALATVTRLGWRDDKAEEFESLCDLLKIEKPVDVLRTLRGMKTSPGFVAEAGRYLIVTPEIVARWAFAKAWAWWFERQPQAMLRAIPTSLLPAFLDRVARSAEVAVRQVVDENFRLWTGELSSLDVESDENLDRLTTLVEYSPQSFLARIVELVEATKVVERSRRHRLVELGTRMCARISVFELGERLLRRLAMQDHEPEVGYEAAPAWRRLFAVRWSDTPIRHESRLALLRPLTRAPDPILRRLAIDALADTLDFEQDHVPHELGPAADPEWDPADVGQLRVEIGRLLELSAEVLDTDVGEARPVMQVMVERVSDFIMHGFIGELRALLLPDRLDEWLRTELLASLESSRTWHAEVNVDHGAAIEEWSEQLAGEGLRGQLRRLVGIWAGPTTPECDDMLSQLAHLLVEQPEVLAEQLTWLCSEEALSPEPLGIAMGKIDSSAMCLEMLFEATARTGHTALVRSYVHGLLRATPSLAARLDASLDHLERTEPALALDIAHGGGNLLHATARAIRLVKSRALPTRILTSSWFWQLKDNIDDEQALCILARLVEAFPHEPDLVSPSVVLLREWLQHSDGEHLLARPEFRRNAWEVLRVRTDVGGENSDRWGRVMLILTPHDYDQAAIIAVRALRTDLALQASNVLLTVVDVAPTLVARAITNTLFESPILGVRGQEWLPSIIAALPPAHVLEQLEIHGIELVRRLARYLPKPNLDTDDSDFEFPAVSARVLERFEHDSVTFEHFLASPCEPWPGNANEPNTYERRVRRSRCFANHDVRRVREWAAIEERRAREAAELLRERAAEDRAARE